MRVVCGVDDHGGAGAHDLESTGHAHRGECFAHDFDVETIAAKEGLDCSECARGVIGLMFAEERQIDLVVDAGQAAQGELLSAEGNHAFEHLKVDALL